MNRLPTRLAIALLAFLSGLAVASFPLIDRRMLTAPIHTPSPCMDGALAASFSREPTPMPEPEFDDHNYTLKIPIIHLEEIYTTQDSLSYEDYVVTRHYDANAERAFATIRRRGRRLASFEESGYPPDKQLAIQFGLFSFLGGERKQLIVGRYSGGAHCCYDFSVYDLYPRFRLIFDSRKYPIRDYITEAVLLDIDRDGRFELSAPVNSFAYFHTPFSGSVMPRIAFKYDEGRGGYGPANQLFPDYGLDRIEEEVKLVEEQNKKDEVPGYDYFYCVLDVTLRLIYAGREKQGWAFFNRAYQNESWASKEQLRAEIKEILSKDGVYRFLYFR